MDHSINRKGFIRQSAVLLAALSVGSSFESNASKKRLAFSTLGCPDWNFDSILAFAQKHHYEGLEIRGLQKQLDLSKVPEFATPAARQISLRKMTDHGLRFVNLGSSCTLHFPEGNERMKQLDEGKRFIEIASELNCPFIRVFPNNFPKDQEKEFTMDLMVKGMNDLAAHAKGSKVDILMETHGDLVRADDILSVMNRVEKKGTGIIWDVANMWTITKESPASVYPKLSPYIKHTHIKDAFFDKGKWNYVLLGKGEVPIFEAIDLLARDRYKGYYSFEWEKLWHPEIDAPEIALADFPLAMSKHQNKK